MNSGNGMPLGKPSIARIPTAGAAVQKRYNRALSTGVEHVNEADVDILRMNHHAIDAWSGNETRELAATHSTP